MNRIPFALDSINAPTEEFSYFTEYGGWIIAVVSVLAIVAIVDIIIFTKKNKNKENKK